MLSTRIVSVLLLIVWSLAFFSLRKRIATLKLYFILLAIMGSAGLFFTELPLMGLAPEEYNPLYILLFSLLMLVVIIPWISFDRFIIRKPIFSIKTVYLQPIRIILFFITLSSLYAIIYSLPYAIEAMSLGADEVRIAILDNSILPHSIFTTLAVGISTFSPIAVLCFYLTLINEKLRRYTIWMVISSLSYIVTSLASCAREGFIYIPLTYICLYFVFNQSIKYEIRKKLKVGSIFFFLLLFIGLGKISFDRFDTLDAISVDDPDNIWFGTWGYFYEQPYVFDHVIDQFREFYGFSRRLHFMGVFIDLPSQEFSFATKLEYMFGTQFAEFYEISGWSSLIICTIFYVIFFDSILILFRKMRKTFSLIIVFTMYFYFTISGMFYFRMGGNDSEFFFYFSIIVLSFFIPNILSVSYKMKRNK